MFKLLVLAVALVACVSCAPADKEICAGCPVGHDVNEDAELITRVTKALAKTNSNSPAKKILSHKTQIVAGTKHIVEYEATDGKKCTISWVEQPWITKEEPQFVKLTC